MSEQATETTIAVQCYGVLEALCGSERRVHVPETPVTVSRLLAELTRELPELAAHLPNTACAVGDRIVGRDERIGSDETLVLIPPVSGG